jgi:serine-type D-Ala-D-Ala carboxypeptidase/endopeptidase
VRTLVPILATLALACGGTVYTDTDTDLPPDDVTGDPEAAAAWQRVTDRLDAAADEGMPETGMTLIVRDREGRIRYRHTVGGFEPDVRVPVASASKLVSGLVLLRQVEQGRLSLDSTTGGVLGWRGVQAGITLDQLGSFVSGYEGRPFCTLRTNITLAQCAFEIGSEPPASTPGSTLDYGPTHQHIAGAMAEEESGQDWNALFRTDLAEPLGLTDPDLRYVTVPKQQAGTTNPLVAGGLLATADEYEAFLAVVVRDGLAWDGTRLLSPGAVDRLFENPFPEARVANTPYEGIADFRYGFGTWLECEGGVPSCDVASSAGAFGTVPWVDRARGYQALLMMEGDAGTATGFSAPLQQEVRPLVEAALDIEDGRDQD